MAEVETEVVANVSSSRTMAGYFMLPSVTPSTKTRWNIRKTTITGSTTRAEAAISRLSWMSYCDWDSKKVRPMARV
jgi:hypothetical protein